VPKKHTVKRWEEARQREKSDRGDEREQTRGRENSERRQVSYEFADLLPCCQNKINPAAPAPLAASDCQSISCPINMSEQTN